MYPPTVGTSELHTKMLLYSMLLASSLAMSAMSEWCYSGCEYTPSHWGELAGSSCSGSRQSPVNIFSHYTVMDPTLLNFTLLNFTSTSVFKEMENTGETIKCVLAEGQVNVSGGGLPGTYVSTQIHFHWGDPKLSLGSEHTIDQQRFHMEMHVVCLMNGMSLQSAGAIPHGIVVLSFLINATDGPVSQPWANLTSYLTNLTTIGSKVNTTLPFSIKDLIGDVDLTKFYRYNGSLTTPNCSEAVVWTVFQEPIGVSRELIKHFSVNTNISNTFRPTQSLNNRTVFTSPAVPPPADKPWCYEHECPYTPGLWSLLPGSQCAGQRQSPVDIATKSVVTDVRLKPFTFTQFDHKQAMDYIINTGESVKCVLKPGMVQISGGGMGQAYSTVQLHFHWGGAPEQPNGSEHTVDSRRFPMEMHIVSTRTNLSQQQATSVTNGIAVLAFFIEETTTTSSSNVWQNFTSYLSHINTTDSKVNATMAISIDDLLGNVDRTSYYRYNGSLTTPGCNEAVVWTIFKDPIRVNKALLDLFPKHTGYSNIYRPQQALNDRTIYVTATATRPSGGPVLAAFLLLLAASCSLQWLTTVSLF